VERVLLPIRGVVDVTDIVAHDVGTNATLRNNVVVNPAAATFQFRHYRPISAEIYFVKLPSQNESARLCSKGRTTNCPQGFIDEHYLSTREEQQLHRCLKRFKLLPRQLQIPADDTCI